MAQERRAGASDKVFGPTANAFLVAGEEQRPFHQGAGRNDIRLLLRAVLQQVYLEKPFEQATHAGHKELDTTEGIKHRKFVARGNSGYLSCLVKCFYTLYNDSKEI